MKQPIEPSKEDCCNSGCNPCVFDVYAKQVKLYEEYLKNGEKSYEVEDNAISQLGYTSFRVVVNRELCPAHKLLAFKRNDVLGKRVYWNAGDHFLFKYNSVGEACTKAYTPIKYKIEESDFEIIVKQYENGVVSNFLCNLLIGQETLWRGPYGSFELITNKFERIIMIAQGTGIAPLYTIIQKVLSNEDDFTKIVLYYCCQSQETVLFRDELYSLLSYWNFTYSIFLSYRSLCNPKYREPIECRKVTFEHIQTLRPFTIKDQFLICGSLTFINIFKTLLITENVTIDNIVLF